MCSMLVLEQAKQATPEPGRVTLEVEANSKTMSGFPAASQRERMSGNST